MKKISSLFIALLFILVAQSVQAAYVPIDIPILTSTFSKDYNATPTSPLGGVTFNFPTVSEAQPYDFFAFDDWMLDKNLNYISTVNTSWGTQALTMTMPVNPISSATTAYLLLNTNWGRPAKLMAGMVTFVTNTGDSSSIFLRGNENIRDWNNSFYTNGLTGSNAEKVFSVTSDSWGLEGRIDMLTVDLRTLLNEPNEKLTNIVFMDYGLDEYGDHSGKEIGYGGEHKSGYASHIRVEGVTIESVPEPSTLLLLALGLCVLGFVRTRFNKA